MYRSAVKAFTDRHPLVGPGFWLLSAQYFIIQWIVARAWVRPYSLSRNTISDLGNTICGQYGGQPVCSPLHSYMNASFILLGICMALGAVLLYQEFCAIKWSAFGFGCLVLAGLGTILVGLFPENTVGGLHTLGATLPFLVGNIGLVSLGLGLKLPPVLRFYTIVSGLLPLIALGFFESSHYLGLGIGGLERLIAYPQTVWLIVFGLYMSRRR